MDELAEAKDAVRTRMRVLRSGLPIEERIRMGGLIQDLLLALPPVREARTILLFYSFGSEVPTAGIAGALQASGRRVLLPFLDEAVMEAAELLPGRPPVVSSYGPKEPADRVPVDPAEVDVVVTPGLAFDRTGYRIGYGGGHYDRYLRRLGPHAVRVGVGFHVQVLPDVPHGPDDERLDLLVTEEETVDCRSQGSGQ
jgi:5-formyltetrahydrofolate cyclo-ligase